MLVETAEDETVIISKCEWDVRGMLEEMKTGAGVGKKEKTTFFCIVHVIGDDNAYVRFRNRSNRIAGFARVILLNPVHQDLPPFVVLLQAVCNTFDHTMVRDQWNNIVEPIQWESGNLGPQDLPCVKNTDQEFEIVIMITGDNNNNNNNNNDNLLNHVNPYIILLLWKSC